MALIATLPPPVPSRPAALDRIAGVSRLLQWLFTAALAVGAVILLGAVLTVLFYEGPRVQVRPGGLQIFIEPGTPRLIQGWTTLGVMPFTRKLALAGSATLMLTPALAILWQLRRLFALYRAGVVLAAENARCLTFMAIWLVAYAVAPTLGHLLVTAAGFDDRGWLRLDSLQALGLGLVLFVMARVMAWAAEVHDDASRFV
ncbi:DUF2975 domain-containing protein [Brevundimonas sp.]|uniref:DUF2975 domain-containing protein n=1 Tax=Brevundimonas sp. TaxID=1871086 RepID=UPI002BDD2841|nr:DUF2975 domain-containing protein [Brevundimonas sp.]HWQ86293.1 DUF2975 domain-containing protein [Brevundimonas sp.]